jgi:hypothetical protein
MRERQVFVVERDDPGTEADPDAVAGFAEAKQRIVPRARRDERAIPASVRFEIERRSGEHADALVARKDPPRPVVGDGDGHLVAPERDDLGGEGVRLGVLEFLRIDEDLDAWAQGDSLSRMRGYRKSPICCL